MGTRGAVRRETCQIVIVDEGPLAHLALRAFFRQAPVFAVAASATTSSEGRRLISRLTPEIVICETRIGDDCGLDLCRWIGVAHPGVMPVVLTSVDDVNLARAALDAGAHAYLLKSSPLEDLLFHLERVAEGQIIVDDRLGRSAVGRGGHRTRFDLSPREQEVLEEIILGLDNRAIAGRLCIAHETVKTHVKSILRKIGARDRAHAIAVVLGDARTGSRW
ncbi:LuxR C-terminal-related transcriptional regulator [Herbidospora cretacea]|uniref:LuxR C-terminal-related transcriptional regulator n=1 Tax=Herbidospora cretacea TaxID=28444 RepID=UPI0009EE886C|nr:response regulator transcription factor [Herbidospora cretacea]